MVDELKKQIKRLENQIVSEKQIIEAFETYTESEMKKTVIIQGRGVIRGLENGIESLNYVLDQIAPAHVQLTLIIKEVKK